MGLEYMSSTWIVNDYLTCIPGTKTFWHMLLEISGTEDKTGVSFNNLADKIESDKCECDLIIRNATFFRPINRNVKQIALLQDIYPGDAQQIDVCSKVDCVVFNSIATKDAYSEHLNKFRRVEIIPLGVNEHLFKSYGSVFKHGTPIGMFVGDYNNTKGAHIFEQIASEKKFMNFIYVSKSGGKINLKNVRNFPGGVNEIGMARLYNESDLVIMCSPVETLHLTSIEGCLCEKPVVGTNTGWLRNYFNECVGVRVDNPTVENFSDAIDAVLRNRNSYAPREYILKNTPFTWAACKSSWKNLIEDVICTM